MAGRTPRATTVLELQGLSHDGRGVGRHGGKAVFVAGGLPGEEVEVRIDRERSRHADATLCGILRPSPWRIAPPCPHYGSCGGCNLQHLDPREQLALRQRQVEEALRRIGGVAAPRWLEPAASPPLAYRSRARLAVEDRAGQPLRLGFRRAESRHVEAIGHCPVLLPGLSALLAPLAVALESLRGERLPHEAWLAAGDEGFAIAFLGASSPSERVREQLRGFAAARGGFAAFGTAARGGEPRWEPTPERLAYAPEPGLRLEFAPWDFTQANRAVNRELVATACALLEPRPEDSALDLFCGAGNFSLPLARRVASVLGIEGAAAQVGQARANATLNGLSNCGFAVADLAAEPLEGAWLRERRDIVLLDPPRTGAATLCRQLPRLRPRAIGYVSCEPSTLARDAALLREGGYRLQAARIFDMFPQTAHVETLAVFTR